MVQRASFTNELWDSITDVYQAILRHPFVVGLIDGTLSESVFRSYVIQDSLYLRDFARSLAVAAARSPRDSWCELFAGHARDALVVERQLHDGFFRDWGLTEQDLLSTMPSPANLAYTSYLLRVAYGHTFEELIGALLPCYWIYWEVGKELEARGSRSRLFQRWIDTYASEEFGQSVRQVLDIANLAIADLPESRRGAVRAHFVTTSRYEWIFWDAAFRQETWPI
jgi:thiaminase/transcriptional activator TenA